MQSAMNEKKNEWSEKTHNLVDKAVSEVKSLDPAKIRHHAAEITTKVRDVSTEYYDDAVTYVRDNPVKAAVGIAAVGFFFGMITAWSRRSD